MSDLNLSEETEHLPRLWTDTLCNKSEKLSRNRSKVKERIRERSKDCTLVEQCSDKTVTCHVLGQTHCINAAEIEEEKQCTCHVFGQTHRKRMNH